MNSLEKPVQANATNEKPDDDEEEGSSSKKKSRLLGSRLITDEINESKPKSRLEVFDKDNRKSKDKAHDSVNDAIDSAEKSETKLPLESLSEAEELEAAQLIRAEARDNRIPDSQDPAELAVNEALNDYDAKIVDEGFMPEVALSEVLEDYGINAEDIDLTELAQEAELEKTLGNEQVIDLNNPHDEGEVVLSHMPDTSNEPTQESVAPNTTGSGGGSSGNNGNNRPPTGFAGGGNQPPSPNPWRSSRFNGNMPSSGSLSNPIYNTIRRDHHDYWSGFMTGGIVGYFIGHRRGRIKTEKKLETVKNKLSRRINAIEKDLNTQEYTIRKLVRNQAELSPRKITDLRAEQKRQAREITNRLSKKELPVPLAAPEIHIGKLVMSERSPKREAAVIAAASGLRVEKSDHKILDKNKQAVLVDSMSNQELLKASEDIIIDGTSLRQIYETQLVGEKGLRRLVNEYVRGGDLKKALKNEVLERQIDFERDPAMRDTASPTSSASAVTDQQSLEAMIKRAEAALSNSQEEVAYLKARVAHDDKQYSQHARSINAIFLAIISFLIAVIILISFLKHG